jgi:steroid delta-isomerase-like uncharacterized protein
MMKLQLRIATGLGLALFMATMIGGPSARADDSQIIQAWVDAWNAHDPEQVASLFANDATYLDVPFNAKSIGTAQIRAFAAFFISASPDLHIQLVRGVFDDHHGTIEWIFSGTDVSIFGTGKKYSFAGVTVIDTENNLITSNIDYYDLETMLCELGLGTVCIPH